MMTVEKLDQAIANVVKDLDALRDTLAEDEPTIEMAVALGALCAASTILHSLLGSAELTKRTPMGRSVRRG